MRFKAQINSTVSKSVDVEDVCPNCKRPTNPHLVNSSYFPIDNDKTSLVLTFRCLGCRHFWTEEFIATRFEINSYTDGYDIDHINVIPNLPSDIPISDNVEMISPIGKQIYIQALKAEQEKLDHIAGIGYRKALEFFVKDFSILINQDDEEKIKDMPLKQVIENYINDEDLKTFALASAYIGNDEGHFYRKNPDKDFTHLKKYLHGVIYYLEKRLMFLDAQELVNRSKKS
ncbi:DUF4145 domain-containing protein [Streptococcus anginosus]|uniref:DUF4145 domain-containing protein n=1 Tax=Streptococcus anginosus TaxID=1328 RepID=A0A6G4N0E3_STRAP|nr:DUF4145 domain-containing protein [Streptococcus anginosus]MCW0988451.1 DUF4145 domain-containing protein [Streptococcus anginosus]NGG16713.1 DUF4145 domain-containing protein [Streptococcus anginosus]NGG24026.1 DUF4145 domain-containing protein [Streptococcus anginosus]